MYDDNDFFATTKFLRLGIRITLTNPMGASPSFSTSFPTPKGDTVSFDEKTLYDLERKLRVLLKSDVPVRTKLAPFAYLGTNFRGLLYCNKGSGEFVVQETHDLFGMESKKVIREADHFFQLLK